MISQEHLTEEHQKYQEAVEQELEPIHDKIVSIHQSLELVSLIWFCFGRVKLEESIEKFEGKIRYFF